GLDAGSGNMFGEGGHSAGSTSEERFAATASTNTSSETSTKPLSQESRTISGQYSTGIEPRRRIAFAVPYWIPRSSAKADRRGERLMMSVCVIPYGYRLHPQIVNPMDMTCTHVNGYDLHHELGSRKERARTTGRTAGSSAQGSGTGRCTSTGVQVWLER